MTSSHHRVVCFGEVLWDVLPTGSLPGGAPMNVAYHLKKLGHDPALITKIGIDDQGEKLVNLLSQSEVSTEYFQVDYEHPTGLVHAKPNEQNEVVYDIVYPVAWDFIDWNDEFTDLMAGAEFFIFGSLTSRNKTSRETLCRLLEAAEKKVLDINLRPPHINRFHIEALLKEATVLKMNLAELELITGWFSEFQSIEERMKVLQDRFAIETIIVTMGGEGAAVSNKGIVHRHEGYKVKVRDTIGSGDAFLAGFVHQLLQGAEVPSALAFATGLGALVATRSGACPLYEPSDITALMNSHGHQKVQTNR